MFAASIALEHGFSLFMECHPNVCSIFITFMKALNRPPATTNFKINNPMPTSYLSLILFPNPYCIVSPVGQVGN